MKGYKFFLEFPDNKTKRKSGRGNIGHSGNCIALATDPEFTYVRNGGIMQEGLSAIFYTRNSPVNWGSVSWDYLRENCKRISEAKAREIHPELFNRLDD